METFLTCYKKNLLLAIEKYPEKYRWAINNEAIESFYFAFRQAMLEKRYSKEGEVFKMTCKKLKIKCTYKDVDHFIVNHV